MYTRVHVFTDKLKHLPSLIALMFRKILMLTLALKEIGLLLNKIQETKSENILQRGVPMRYRCGLCLSYISSGGLCL